MGFTASQCKALERVTGAVPQSIRMHIIRYDGRNPAPVDMENIHFFAVSQYISSIHSIFQFHNLQVSVQCMTDVVHQRNAEDQGLISCLDLGLLNATVLVGLQYMLLMQVMLPSNSNLDRLTLISRSFRDVSLRRRFHCRQAVFEKEHGSTVKLLIVPRFGSRIWLLSGAAFGVEGSSFREKTTSKYSMNLQF